MVVRQLAHRAEGASSLGERLLWNDSLLLRRRQAIHLLELILALDLLYPVSVLVLVGDVLQLLKVILSDVLGPRQVLHELVHLMS